MRECKNRIIMLLILFAILISLYILLLKYAVDISLCAFNEYSKSDMTQETMIINKFMLNKIKMQEQNQSENIEIENHAGRNDNSNYYHFNELIYIESAIYENTSENIIFKDKELPHGVSGTFKTYMDFRKLTNRSSKQYELQQSATTDENGFRRYNDLYMVALGTYFAPSAGLEFEIELCSGKIINCITGDIKDNRHTDPSNRYVQHDGNIVEFIVDVSKINRLSRVMGDMSYSDMEGSVIRITQIIRENNGGKYEN